MARLTMAKPFTSKIEVFGKWTDPRAIYGAREPRYVVVQRYGKWRVIDTYTHTVLTKVNSRALAEVYLRLLGEEQ